ncbi:hypothetical protein KCP70_13485 [Salmonella enterica subsp. enterica]|nr:hypothetical protein KCP70_13485 [Salmonella enterica subsp. enterica]
MVTFAKLIPAGVSPMAQTGPARTVRRFKALTADGSPCLRFFSFVWRNHGCR